MNNLGYISAHPRQYSNEICFVLHISGAIFQINSSSLKSSCSNEIILHKNTYCIVFDKDIDIEDVFMYIFIMSNLTNIRDITHLLILDLKSLQLL